MPDIEELARQAIDCGFNIHQHLGPGLLEAVYEAMLASSLNRRAFREGIKRVVNNLTDFASSRLRVNQSSLIQLTPIEE